MIGSVSAERFIGKSGTASATYVVIRGNHQWGSGNFNAPLPGSSPAIPNSGVRPFGGSQNLYEFHSEGIQKTRVFRSIPG